MKTNNLNFMGLHSAYVADIQDPNRVDQPVNWTKVGEFLVDSVTFGRDDASQFDVMVEEKDDAIFTEYTQQPLKMAGNMPNLTGDGKILLGGYTRKLDATTKKITLSAPAQTPTVTKMVKLVPKSGKYDHIIIYSATINLNIGDNLSKTATLNDKLSLATIAPTDDMIWAGGSAYAIVGDASAYNDILSFETVLPEVSNVIDATAHTVTISVPNGTVVTAVKPFITVSQGAVVENQAAPGVDPNFVATDFSSPVTYTVTPEDGSAAQAWTVTITVLP